jgi:hypothetical protein
MNDPSSKRSARLLDYRTDEEKFKDSSGTLFQSRDRKGAVSSTAP